MNTFDERKKAYEAKFLQDEDLKFKLRARRNKRIAEWAAKLIGKTNDGLYNVQITGDLTIKSTTRPITFNAIIDLDSKVKKATGTLTFNRTDFGVQYRAEMHLDNPDSFWNQLRSARDTTKDRVIRDEIEIEFEMNSLPGMLRK